MYVRPSMTYGCEFAIGDSAALDRLDHQFRRFGRRLLGWPAASPNIAVLGELGWHDSYSLALDQAAGLFARLRSLMGGQPSEVQGRFIKAPSNFHRRFIEGPSKDRRRFIEASLELHRYFIEERGCPSR